MTSIAAFVTGLLIGSIEILYFNNRFIKTSFGKKILYKSVLYLSIVLLFLVMLTAIANARQMQVSFFDVAVWNNVRQFFFTFAFWSTIIFIASIVVIAQFYAEVSENIGLDVLNNFFTGKYHRPIEEERIYMFLDMRSSTTIAEHLGHVKYFEMLREYYAGLSDSIVRYAGEIYQYVGDEVVISWKRKQGLHNHNCIQCFFAMKAALAKQAAKYKEKFGVLPEFKAGLHVGKVTTGEIGVIKKDIIFTGDVLNTTARIQGLCNNYKVDVLLSGELAKALSLPASLRLVPLGEKELRGREEKIALFTVEAS
jgi:adenylate cyclase